MQRVANNIAEADTLRAESRKLTAGFPQRATDQSLTGLLPRAMMPPANYLESGG